MVTVEYSLPYGVRIMSVYLTETEHRSFAVQNSLPKKTTEKVSQNSSLKRSTKRPMQEDTICQSNSAKDYESICTRTPNSAPQQKQKVATIPSLTEVLTGMKSSSIDCGTDSVGVTEPKESVEVTPNAAKDDMLESKRGRRQINVDSGGDVLNEKNKEGDGRIRYDTGEFAANMGQNVLGNHGEDESDNASVERVVGNGDIRGEKSIRDEQDATMQTRQNCDVPNGLAKSLEHSEGLVDIDTVVPDPQEKRRTCDVEKNNPEPESKVIYHQDPSGNNGVCITSDSQLTTHEIESSVTTNDEHVINHDGDYSYNGSHSNDCNYGDDSHHGSCSGSSDGNTLTNKSVDSDDICNSIESKVQLTLPPVTNGENHGDATSHHEEENSDTDNETRTETLEDQSNDSLAKTNSQLLPPLSRSTEHEQCDSETSEMAQNVERPQKQDRDPSNVSDSKTVEDASNNVQDDTSIQIPCLLLCDSMQEQSKPVNTATVLEKDNSSIVDNSLVEIASGDYKKNTEEDHVSSKAAENDDCSPGEIASGGDAGLNIDNVAAGESPLSDEAGGSDEDLQEGHGSLKTAHSEDSSSRDAYAQDTEDHEIKTLKRAPSTSVTPNNMNQVCWNVIE